MWGKNFWHCEISIPQDKRPHDKNRDRETFASQCWCSRRANPTIGHPWNLSFWPQHLCCAGSTTAQPPVNSLDNWCKHFCYAFDKPSLSTSDEPPSHLTNQSPNRFPNEYPEHFPNQPTIFLSPTSVDSGDQNLLATVHHPRNPTSSTLLKYQSHGPIQSPAFKSTP